MDVIALKISYMNMALLRVCRLWEYQQVSTTSFLERTGFVKRGHSRETRDWISAV
jgi:hypothetical protein